MKEPKNILVPYSDFKAILGVLEYVDVSNYTEDFQRQFESVLEGMRAKQKSIELRDAYSRMIYENKHGNEETQLEARIEYLKLKNER